MQQGSAKRDEVRARRAIAMLERMRNGGIAIVEGKHDVPKLKALGVNVITYGAAMSRGPFEGPGTPTGPGRKVFVLTDDDRGGEEKKSKLISSLLERDKSLVIDTELGARMLKSLNVRCFEQIGRPMAELLAKREMRIGEYYGEDILGHRKVHGRSELQHRRTR